MHMVKRTRCAQEVSRGGTTRLARPGWHRRYHERAPPVVETARCSRAGRKEAGTLQVGACVSVHQCVASAACFPQA